MSKIPSYTFSFNGNASEYFHICVVNWLLTLITFGIYRPWAKVRTLRYLYANIGIGEHAFDYHATGKQLFLSYLIGAGLLLAYVCVAVVFPIGELIAIALIFISAPWVIMRSIKFNASVTSFSNVRFRFQGGYMQAFIAYLLIPFGYVVVPATMFAIYSWDALDLQAWHITCMIVLSVISMIVVWSYFTYYSTLYVINHYAFGQERFTAKLSKGFYLGVYMKYFVFYVFLLLLVSSLLGLFVFVDLGYEQWVLIKNSLFQGDIIGMMKYLTPSYFILFYVALVAIPYVLHAYLYTATRTYLYAQCLLGDEVTFTSRLPFLTFAKILFTNVILLVVTLGLAYPWVQIRTLQCILTHTDLHGLDINKYISEAVEKQSALGYELGEAFDVDVNLGI